MYSDAIRKSFSAEVLFLFENGKQSTMQCDVSVLINGEIIVKAFGNYYYAVINENNVHQVNTKCGLCRI